MPRTARYAQSINNTGYLEEVTEPSATGTVMQGELKINGKTFRARCYPSKKCLLIKLAPTTPPFDN